MHENTAPENPDTPATALNDEGRTYTSADERDRLGDDYPEPDDAPDFDVDEDAERLQRDYDEGRITDRDALAGLLNLAAGNPVAQYQTERDNENDG